MKEKTRALQIKSWPVFYSEDFINRELRNTGKNQIEIVGF
jgi:hypothetical protein